MEVLVRILPDAADRKWYGAEVLLEIVPWGHFPTRVVSKVGENGRYYDAYGIGMKIRGVMGSGNVGINRAGIPKATELLEAAGYKVTTPEPAPSSQ
jgi:hypothetical protein